MRFERKTMRKIGWSISWIGPNAHIPVNLTLVVVVMCLVIVHGLASAQAQLVILSYKYIQFDFLHQVRCVVYLHASVGVRD